MLMLAGSTAEQVADAMGNSYDIVYKHYFIDKENTLGAQAVAKTAAAMAGRQYEAPANRTLEAPLPELELEGDVL